MLIKVRRGWELPESVATPEEVFVQRRQIAKLFAAGTLVAPLLAACSEDEGDSSGGDSSENISRDPPTDTANLYPASRNLRYRIDRPVTEEVVTTSFNNFFEFGSHKQIASIAQNMALRPWTVRIDGLVENEREVDIDDLLRTMSLEERLYRHRCVEAWSIAVPWTGFPMSDLIQFAQPLSGAKYIRMETAMDEESMTGLRQVWYTWPYVEGLTMEEASNELAFLVTGAYGKPALPQNGAPIRLAVPWKYGFKSIKSIVRFTFTDERPRSFWEITGPSEYGFWANVNPDVPHRRWSQAEERFLTADGAKMMPTQLFNGYADFVAHLYDGLENEELFT